MKCKLGYGFNVFSEDDILSSTITTKLLVNESILKKIKKEKMNKFDENYIKALDAIKFSNMYKEQVYKNLYGHVISTKNNLNEMFDKLTSNKKICSEKFELYYKEYITSKISIELEEVKNNLSSNFLKDIKNLKKAKDCEKFYSKYGTHLITSYLCGGRFELYNYTYTTSETQDIHKTLSLKEKTELMIEKYKNGNLFSYKDEFISNENNNYTNTFTKYKLTNTQKNKHTIDEFFNCNTKNEKQNSLFNEWVNSLNDTSEIVNYDKNSTHLIYQIIPDEFKVIKELLKETYVELCNKKIDSYNMKYPLNKTIRKKVEIEDYIHTYGIHQYKKDSYRYLDTLDKVEVDCIFNIDYYSSRKLHTNQWSVDSKAIEILDDKKGVFKVVGKCNDKFKITLHSDNKVIYSKSMKITKEASRSKTEIPNDLFNLKVDKYSLKTKFYLGEEFSINNKSFSYFSNKMEKIAYKDIFFETNFNKNKLGKYNVSINIKGFTHTYEIEVVDISILYINPTTNKNAIFGSITPPLEEYEIEFVLENGKSLNINELDKNKYSRNKLKIILPDCSYFTLGTNKVLFRYEKLEAFLFQEAIKEI